MTFSHRVPCFRLDFRAPVVVMVLAAIAIPIELRWPAYDSSGIKLSLPFFADVIENILGFIPVGIVLTALGPARAIAIAASMSALSELGQLMMAHRDPSVIDVISNVTGAGLGVAIASRWNITPPPLPVSARISLLAAFLAGIVIVTEWMTLPPLPNARGATLLGRLEADWELGEGNGRLVQDRSGYGLNGRFSREPKRTHSENVLAAQFDGARDSVNFGQAAALRLVGSTTITAWIKSTSFPRDDAAIVSSFSGGGAGFQLDTTIDAGPRTIGFKIWNECGALAARYGTTPLVSDTWYHIAGVYDSDERSLAVYLNGGLDNGFLLGTVTGRQKSSRWDLYVGRRSDLTGFEFSGFIRNARIYSRALSGAEIVSDMRGAPPMPKLATGRETIGQPTSAHAAARASCAISSDSEDKSYPIASAAVGLLVAVAAVGLWPDAGVLIWLLASFASGMLLPISALPPINLIMGPLTALAGGISVVVSLRR